MSMNLLFFDKDGKDDRDDKGDRDDRDDGNDKDGVQKLVLTLRFGVLANMRTFVCVDLNWLDGSVLFTEAAAGGLKMVCHGRGIEREDVEKVILSSLPCFHEATVEISGIC